MPCFLVILALFLPRVVVLILWFFTDWFHGVFDVLLWPILGLIFLPLTLLWYSAVVNWYGGVWSIVPVLGLIFAVLLDLSPSGGVARE
jgi:hypothetical protein